MSQGLAYLLEASVQQSCPPCLLIERLLLQTSFPGSWHTESCWGQVPQSISRNSCSRMHLGTLSGWKCSLTLLMLSWDLVPRALNFQVLLHHGRQTWEIVNKPSPSQHGVYVPLSWRRQMNAYCQELMKLYRIRAHSWSLLIILKGRLKYLSRPPQPFPYYNGIYILLYFSCRL